MADLTLPAVEVLAWSRAGVMAEVDGVRVQMRTHRSGHTSWHCRDCGSRRGLGHCRHTKALADTNSRDNDRARRRTAL